MMKRTLFLSILVVILTASLIGCSNKNKIKKGNNDFQKECQYNCEKWFNLNKEKYDTGRLVYRYHYNRKLHKCFILVNNLDLRLMNLKDINENENYGSFLTKQQNGSIITCDVSGKSCKSEKEWNALVKPYMEE
jgi:hypothetical protein